MKKIILLLVLTVFAMTWLAASPKEEALESLDNAKNLIQSDSFVKAQDEINFAMAKISELLAEELVKYIPETVPGLTFDEKESQSLGAAGAMIGSANSIVATGKYSKGDISIDLTITVGGIAGQAGGLMGLASMFGGVTSSTGKTIRVNGYSGTQEFDKDENSGTLTISVGNKITVLVSGDGLQNADILKTVAEKVDMAKLEKSF